MSKLRRWGWKGGTRLPTPGAKRVRPVELSKGTEEKARRREEKEN